MRAKIVTWLVAGLIFACFSINLAFPGVPDDDRFLDPEYASPGGHQLASWLISQIRKSDGANHPAQSNQIIIPYRLPLTRKRNSELTSAIMGLPTNMIDNGRK